MELSSTLQLEQMSLGDTKESYAVSVYPIEDFKLTQRCLQLFSTFAHFPPSRFISRTLPLLPAPLNSLVTSSSPFPPIPLSNEMPLSPESASSANSSSTSLSLSSTVKFSSISIRITTNQSLRFVNCSAPFSTATNARD